MGACAILSKTARRSKLCSSRRVSVLLHGFADVIHFRAQSCPRLQGDHALFRKRHVPALLMAAHDNTASDAHTRSSAMSALEAFAEDPSGSVYLVHQCAVLSWCRCAAMRVGWSKVFRLIARLQVQVNLFLIGVQLSMAQTRSIVQRIEQCL